VISTTAISAMLINATTGQGQMGFARKDTIRGVGFQCSVGCAAELLSVDAYVADVAAIAGSGVREGTSVGDSQDEVESVDGWSS